MEYIEEYKYYLQRYINNDKVTLSLSLQLLVATALAASGEKSALPLTQSEFVQQMNDYITASVV